MNLTKVEVGISTYVGYGLAALGYVALVINNLASNSNLLHISPAWLATISTAVAVATTLGRQLQAAMQNQGVAIVPPVPDPAPVVIAPGTPENLAAAQAMVDAAAATNQPA